MGQLFGTDGVRGLANQELTPEMAFQLGKAGAYVLTRRTHHTPQILVGTDTRMSCDMLQAALCAGMCSVGAKVLLAGVVPTPAVAYLVRAYNLDAGVVISASHNPFHDNGIKFFNGDGYKLADDIEDEIERIMNEALDTLPRPTGDKVGHSVPCPQALPDYVDFLLQIAQGVDLTGVKVAIDCANGATYQAAPRLFEKLGASLHVLHNSPNGTNINAGCGSTHMESLMAYVTENGMDLGIAFDGDGDRCLMVDEKGKLVDGDQIMSMCSMYLKEQGKLKDDTLVATVMSNLGLFVMGRNKGITVEQTKVGDRYVLERMLQGGFSIGGEQSGHIIFLEHNTTGDGLLTALMMVRMLKEKGQSMSAMNSLMEVLPQVLVNAKVGNAKKNTYTENAVIQAEIQKIEEALAGEGRVLIRPSGTEPVIRVMLEGKDQAFLDREAHRLASLFEAELADE